MKIMKLQEMRRQHSLGHNKLQAAEWLHHLHLKKPKRNTNCADDAPGAEKPPVK